MNNRYGLLALVAFISVQAEFQDKPALTSSASSLANDQLLNDQPAQEQLSTYQRIKNKALKYVQDFLPKTKKDWVKAVISEGIAEGIMFYNGFGLLKSYYRNKEQDKIDQSKGRGGIFTGDLTKQSEENVDKEVKEAVDEVLVKTGLKKKVKVHYASGVTGAFAHAREHIFISPHVGESVGSQKIPSWIKPHSIEEHKFITAHELGHIQSKDMLKFGVGMAAAPVLTYAATKAYDQATRKLIDRIIKEMGLDEKSLGYRMLTKIKTVQSRIITNPIVRYIIASHIFAAYSRYLEKNADLFAAKHGYAKGGASWTKRIGKNINPFGESSESLDVLHPPFNERASYLEKFEETEK